MWTTVDYPGILPHTIYQEMLEKKVDFQEINEIRIRRNKPSLLVHRGMHTELKGLNNQEFDSYFLSLCKHSPYAYAEEIRNGYISIKGGHRIGICGQVINKDGKISGISFISSINIRIHREHPGCINEVVSKLHEKNKWLNTLIVSTPGAGKTTLLRDLIRVASNGVQSWDGEKIRPNTVSLIDERNEIAASVMGIPELDVGRNTDVLSMSNKSEGILMMLRSMAPEIIAFDELGGEEDYLAVKKAVYSGVSIFTTVHGRNRSNIVSNPFMECLLKEGIFDRILYLDSPINPGKVVMVTDGKGQEIMFKENRR